MPRVGGQAQLVVAELAHHGVRRERGLGGADHHRVGAAPDGPAGVREHVQAAGLVVGEHPARAPEAAADRDLAGAGRVEPGDGLVRADELRPAAPQLLQLALAELAAARAGRGDHADRERRVRVRRQVGFGQGEFRGRHGEVAEPVGLYEEAVLDQPGRVEAVLDLARDLQREPLAALPADRAEHRTAQLHRLPERLGAHAVRRDDADPGDHGLPAAAVGPAHDVLLSACASTTADWKPPKPLPTDSTDRSRTCRAVRGT